MSSLSQSNQSHRKSGERLPYGDSALVLAAIRDQMKKKDMFTVQGLEGETESEKFWRRAAGNSSGE